MIDLAQMRLEASILDNEIGWSAETFKVAATEIERLREYACHKIGCAALHQMGAKCDCGLSELVGPREVSKP